MSKTSLNNRSRRSLFLIITVFALPLVLAKLALHFQLLDYGVTNHGDLAAKEVTLTTLGLAEFNFDHQWLLLYYPPDDCDRFCEQILLTINNTYIALGKEMPRVTPVALTSTGPTRQQRSAMQHAKWKIIPIPEQAQTRLDHKKILIIDPLTHVVLSHTLPSSEQALTQLGKAILADMKKLLKYSRLD